MRCPFCSHDDTKVIDTRQIGDGIRRRRECLQCEQRFTTYERMAPVSLMVQKSDGRREEFNRDKLLRGLRVACAKRPISTETIENLVSDIETSLFGLGQSEISSQQIGELVMARLRDLDDVAYVRFASVYRRFTDLDSLISEVEALKYQKQREEELRRQLRLAL
ncbi:MAG: transcriptional repressor NrdR [Chloroflexi bacterium]|nr:transcriptional repressor NrdR [Chloroflexota bacterium]